MTALPTALHTFDLDGLLSICDPFVHHLMIGGPLIGWAAAAIVIVVSVGCVHGLVRSRRAARITRAAAALGTKWRRGDYEFVVLPTVALVAVGVHRPRPQVVVSKGLIDELDEERINAVIGHELAHLHLRHGRYLVGVSTVECALGFLPMVRRSAQVVRDAVETWADDAAIEGAHASDLALHSALHTVARANRHPDDLQAIGTVATRARRLMAPAPCLSATVRGLNYLPAGGLLSSAALLVVGWALTSQRLLGVGPSC
jgi:hypothetical protein